MKKLKLSEEQLIQLIERTINEQSPLYGMDEEQIIEDLDRMLEDILEYSQRLERFCSLPKEVYKNARTKYEMEIKRFKRYCSRIKLYN